MKFDEIRSQLTLVAKESIIPRMQYYGLDGSGLEARLLWKPTVLVLGNYSSGKSTLINEILGAEIQQTGQAPTDDSFTVLTADHESPTSKTSLPVVTESHSGPMVLGDLTLPFQKLKRHGRALSSHFKLKKVTSPALNNLVLIDSPGMLDSVTERDRGYNYAEVVGELTSLVDLVLYLFDPHKAGTIRESFNFLRETLPSSISENRVLFVINRVDECTNLNDLLRVYGTLCWNLSQMTGRKDIPPIYLMWSATAAKFQHEPLGHLQFLENQRETVKKAILDSPQNHIDHLIEDFERSAKGIKVCLGSLLIMAVAQRSFFWRLTGIGAATSVLLVVIAAISAMSVVDIFSFSLTQLTLLAAFGFFVFLTLWNALITFPLLSKRRAKDAEEVQKHEGNGSPEEKELWLSNRQAIYTFAKSNPKLSVGQLKRDMKMTQDSLDKILKPQGS